MLPFPVRCNRRGGGDARFTSIGVGATEGIPHHPPRGPAGPGLASVFGGCRAATTPSGRFSIGEASNLYVAFNDNCLDMTRANPAGAWGDDSRRPDFRQHHHLRD
jgi:hypothetical protein